MDEILITDVLQHYLGKLTEAMEELTSCENQLRLISESMADIWQGYSAAAMDTKLLEAQKTLDACKTDVEQAKICLGDLFPEE